MKNKTAGVRVPDPVLEQPKINTSFKKKAMTLFFIGFLFGWVWVSHAAYVDQFYGINGLPFWRILLPF